MKIRSIVVLVSLALAAASGARAGSTIDPTVPALGSAFVSGPVRSNFGAAYNDINNLLSQFSGSTAPVNPTIGQYWRDTGVSPSQVFQWTGSTWAQVATFDAINNAVTPYLGSALLAWQELIQGLGTVGQCVVFNGASSLPTAQNCLRPGDIAATAPLLATFSGIGATLSLNLDSNFAVSGGNLALNPIASGDLLCNSGVSAAEPGQCSWNQFASRALGTVANSFPIYAAGTWQTKALGASVADPGTGTIEDLLQPVTPTISANAITLGQAALFTEQRLANGGTAFTVTLPPSTTLGMSNGTPIQINNTDASAIATLTAGSGTQICAPTCGSTASIGPGRSTKWILDTTIAPPSWRPTMNSLSALLAANNLSDLANIGTARDTLIPTNSLTLSQFPTIGVNTVLGSLAGGTPIALSQVQLTSLINPATASLSGALPPWPNNTTTFFRGDGTYQSLNFAALGGQETFAQLPNVNPDNVVGNPTASAAAPTTMPLVNCSNALTYSTSTHAFGCNSSGGTGTLTEQKNTFGYGIISSGNCDNTSTNAASPCNAAASLSSLTNSIGSDVALNNTSSYFPGPSVAQGSTGTWFASGNVTVTDTAGGAAIFCKLWDGTNVIDSGALNTQGASGLLGMHLSGVITSPAGNINISCRDLTATTGLIKANTTGQGKDSTIEVVRIN